LGLFKWLFTVAFFSSYSITANDQLLFVVSFPGSAPYLYQEPDNENYLGIIPDILNALTNMEQINIRFVANSRKRSEEYLYQRKADMMLISKSWLRYPEKLIATVPLHQHRSFLYQTAKFSDNFSLKNNSKRKKVCTRKGFVYPHLAPYFKNKKLVRIDSSSQTTTIKMLFKKRCDLVILSEYHALTIMKLPIFNNKKLFRSPHPISVVPLNIVLRPELSHVKALLDVHINELKKSGQLKRIVSEYIQ